MSAYLSSPDDDDADMRQQTLETSCGTTEQSTGRFIVGDNLAQQDLLHMTRSCGVIQASTLDKPKYTSIVMAERRFRTAIMQDMTPGTFSDMTTG